MNRKQRRQLKKSKERTYTVKESDMKKYEHNTVNSMFYILVSIGCLTIKKHFSKLIKVEVDGQNRMQRFFDLYTQTYQEWSAGKIKNSEIEDFMKSEVGIIKE